jgi:hypothetical protein
MYITPNNKMNNTKIGFWKSGSEPESESELPSPIISDNIYGDDFIKKCNEWSNVSVSLYDPRVVHYMGYSNCRICGELNGTKEFTYGGFTFPSGIFHYVTEHNIEIDEEFVQMILNEPIIKKPSFEEERALAKFKRDMNRLHLLYDKSNLRYSN